MIQILLGYYDNVTIISTKKSMKHLQESLYIYMCLLLLMLLSILQFSSNSPLVYSILFSSTLVAQFTTRSELVGVSLERRRRAGLSLSLFSVKKREPRGSKKNGSFSFFYSFFFLVAVLAACWLVFWGEILIQVVLFSPLEDMIGSEWENGLQVGGAHPPVSISSLFFFFFFYSQEKKERIDYPYYKKRGQKQEVEEGIELYISSHFFF